LTRRIGWRYSCRRRRSRRCWVRAAEQNEQLRALLWTGNRTQLDGTKLGLAEAVRYEQAVGASILGFSHVVAALKTAGQY
jgi:hypothetical protein